MDKNSNIVTAGASRAPHRSLFYACLLYTSVAAAGALALLIPPSVGFIVYGEIADESVGQLFIGGIVPGLMLALMMMAYVGIYAYLNPKVAPRSDESVTWGLRMESLLRVWPALVLILAVLGSIYFCLLYTSRCV